MSLNLNSSASSDHSDINIENIIDLVHLENLIAPSVDLQIDRVESQDLLINDGPNAAAEPDSPKSSVILFADDSDSDSGSDKEAPPRLPQVCKTGLSLTMEKAQLLPLMLPETIKTQHKTLQDALVRYKQVVAAATVADKIKDVVLRYQCYLLPLIERMLVLSREQLSAMEGNEDAPARPMRLLVHHVASVAGRLDDLDNQDSLFQSLAKHCLASATEQDLAIAQDTLQVFVVSTYARDAEKYCVRQKGNVFVIAGRDHFLTILKSLPVHLYVSVDAADNWAAFHASISVLCRFTGFEHHFQDKQHWLQTLLKHDYTYKSLKQLERDFQRSNVLNRSSEHSLTFRLSGGESLYKGLLHLSKQVVDKGLKNIVNGFSSFYASQFKN